VAKKEIKTDVAENENHRLIKKCQIILDDGQEVILRPLEIVDKTRLASFYSGLSKSTQNFYVLDDYGEKTATRLCDSINNPEKMHFVLENDLKEIIAIMKFSLDLPEADRVRFSRHGIDLIPGTVSRCGLCIADDYQNMGLGAIALQQVIDTSDSLGLRVIMLSGGIFANNGRAIYLTQKYGFQVVGKFTDSNGQEHVDLLRINKLVNEEN